MKKIIGFFIFLLLFVVGCSSSTASSGGSVTPDTGVEIGSLPNGSSVYISNNNLPVTESTPTSTTVYLVGGSANASYSVNFVSSKLQNSRLNIQDQLAVAESTGISVTPNPCVIGTTGSGAASSCKVTIAVASTTQPGTYTITPVASAANESPTILSPITVLVSGSVQPSSKAITSFSLNGTAGTITGNNIAVTMPSGTNPRALVATYITTGVAVSVGNVTQTNGVTANNFTSPVKYTVHAADGSTQDYTVTVSIASSSAKAITAFSLDGTAGTITDTTISVIMPYGTDLSSLVATFTTTGQSVTIGSTPQVSGVTTNDFSGDLIYTVHAADGSTQDYTVHVTTALNDAKELTAFSVAGTVGAINQENETINVELPYGSTTTGLLATTFTTTGVTVSVNGTAVTSGVTQDFATQPVTYVVTAEDGTSKSYAVRVTAQPILTEPTGIVINGSYAFLTSNVSSNITQCLISDEGVLSACSNLDLSTWLPNGALSISVADNGSTSLATIIGNGATDSDNPIMVSCPISSGIVTTPCTTHNISPPTTLSQRVSLATNLVAQVSNSDDLITSFSINVGSAGESFAGVIDQTAKSIRVTVPYGVSLNGLVANFTVNGAKTVVKIGSTTQRSGVTANNFPASSYLTYDVTPSGGTTVQYQVFVRNSTFAASAVNYNQGIDTIILSFVPYFITETPFASPAPDPYFDYYELSSATPPFNMTGLSSIAYTNYYNTAYFYTVTNIADNNTYTCNITAAPYQIAPANCKSTTTDAATVINQPSSVVSLMSNGNGALTYIASYSDNVVIPCVSNGTNYYCADDHVSGLPVISNVDLNYPRSMSFKLSASLLTIVNEGDNSYVSCKLAPTTPITYNCTKHFFKDL